MRCVLYLNKTLTGVEEDHGFEADELLPLQFELSHSGRGGQQHVEDLHETLHTGALLSVENTSQTFCNYSLSQHLLKYLRVSSLIQWMMIFKTFQIKISTEKLAQM